MPNELLRRSTRLLSKVSSDKLIQPVKQETEGANKTSAVNTTDTNPIRRLKKIKTEQQSSNTPSQDSKQPVCLYNTLPQPDGVMKIDSDELDLERTLLGGQSFRWNKLIGYDQQQKTNVTPLFTGVILDKVIQLWRLAPDEIAFKCLNCEPLEKCPTSIETENVIKDYFQLQYKLKDLYEEWSRKDEHLAKSCQELKGFRILRQDPVENVFSFICATNNNIKRITQMVDNLCRRFGSIVSTVKSEPFTSESQLYHTFPSVERLAEPDVFDCLRYELGFGYRAKFITETAKKLLQISEQASIEPRDFLLSLRSLPYKETCKQLMQFQGIGRKVADCICLMSMDHLESVPIDCHIYDIVCRHYMPKLRQERKSLTDGVHDLIGDYFNSLHGSMAGWSTSVLFIGELRHLKASSSCSTSESASIRKTQPTKRKSKSNSIRPGKIESNCK